MDRKEYQKEYRAKNKEKLDLQAKEYREKNKEKAAEYSKIYREKNREHLLFKHREYWNRTKVERNKKSKEYRDGIGKAIKKETGRKYYLKNSEKIKNRIKLYGQNNEQKVKEYKKQYRRDKSEYFKKYMREYVFNRRRSDPIFKLIGIIRGRLRDMLRAQSVEKNTKTIESIGCSLEFLKFHLESQFQEGMSWESHGVKGWHIDHIKPVSSFDLSDPKQLKKCNHYTNLQPLWAKENIIKSNKIT